MGALVADPGLAALAGVAGRAAAGVGALARVSAGGSVLAGPVGIEIGLKTADFRLKMDDFWVKITDFRLNNYWFEV